MEDMSAWTFLYRNQMFFKLQILKKIKIICNIFFFNFILNAFSI